jgi:iron complex transport system substrate-binding protein
VCAIPSGQVDDALGYLGCRADVLSLDPHSLEDVLASVLLVGERTGTADVAQNLVGALRARLERVASVVAGRERPRVAVVEWVDPPFTAGHWVPDLIRAAGGEPVGAKGTVGADQLVGDPIRMPRRGHRGALRVPPRRRGRAGQRDPRRTAA